MYSLVEFNKELSEVLDGLEKNGHIDTLELFKPTDKSIELKLAAKNETIDLLKKFFENKLFLQAKANGWITHHYRTGPINGEPGMSVVEVSISMPCAIQANLTES